MLLLDEPVTGLDPKAQNDLYELIAKLNRDGITIIMVSHDVRASVQYASHILHIGAKKQLFFGTAGQSITTDWVAITGYCKTLFGGWESAHVTVCGGTLTTYDPDTLTWSSAASPYVARWDDDSNSIIIARA